MSRRGITRGLPQAHTAPTTAASTVTFTPAAAIGASAEVAGAGTVGFTPAAAIGAFAEIAGDSPVGFTPTATGSAVPLNDGMVFWLRADAGITKDGSDRVSQWDDQSGTGDSNKNVTQAVAGSKPLWNASSANFNNLPTLTFDNTRPDHLTSGNWGVAMPSPATWVIVGRITGYDPSGFTVMIDSKAVGSRQAAYYVTADNKLNWYAGAAAAGTAIAPPHTFANIVVFDTTGNAYQTAQTPTAGNSGAQTLAAVSIGINYDQSGSAFHGEIAEIMGFNRELTAPEVAELFSYINTRYGIAIGA